MQSKILWRALAICGVVASLAGCTVYQPAYPQPAYEQPAYQAPAPYYGGGGYYPAPPAYAYAPAPYYAPAYVGPSIGLNFGFWGGGGGHRGGWGHHGH